MVLSLDEIRDNIERVREAIAASAEKAGRDPAEVRFIAVTKGFPIEAVLDALLCGLRDFGENYAQEFRDKLLSVSECCGEVVNWHFIGKLQANKVKYVAGRVRLIHSLDSVKVAREIEKRSAKAGVCTSVLLEVNIAGIPERGGIKEAELGDYLSKISVMKHVEVRGLMTMAPLSKHPEEARPYFRALREMRDRHVERYPRLRELSMGMSDDYIVAIEEGATYVRIGRAIFGPRD